MPVASSLIFYCWSANLIYGLGAQLPWQWISHPCSSRCWSYFIFAWSLCRPLPVRCTVLWIIIIIYDNSLLLVYCHLKWGNKDSKGNAFHMESTMYGISLSCCMKSQYETMTWRRVVLAPFYHGCHDDGFFLSGWMCGRDNWKGACWQAATCCNANIWQRLHQVGQVHFRLWLPFCFHLHPEQHTAYNL